MRVSEVKLLRVSGIWRNYYKFRLSKYEIKFMNFKAVCANEKCNSSVILIQKDIYCCKANCGSQKATLKTWAIVLCMDATG